MFLCCLFVFFVYSILWYWVTHFLGVIQWNKKEIQTECEFKLKKMNQSKRNEKRNLPPKNWVNLFCHFVGVVYSRELTNSIYAKSKWHPKKNNFFLFLFHFEPDKPPRLQNNKIMSEHAWLENKKKTSSEF